VLGESPGRLSGRTGGGGPAAEAEAGRPDLEDRQDPRQREWTGARAEAGGGGNWKGRGHAKQEGAWGSWGVCRLLPPPWSGTAGDAHSAAGRLE
jgi:hypothetical protein